MVHGKALAIVVAYDMYLECTEGQLDASWRIKKLVDFFRFREKLGKQILTYSPKLCKYPGDQLFREATQTPKRDRHKRYCRGPPRSSSSSTSSGSVSIEALLEEVQCG